MVIHFTAARKSVKDNLETLRTIISAFHEQGHVLARDWIEPFRIATEKGLDDTSSEDIYRLNMDAITRADLVVVEGSELSFGSGFQVAAALMRKKPVLLLVEASKARDKNSLSRGITDPLLRYCLYTKTSLRNEISSFIEDNTVSTKDLRFNFVIDRQLYNHIRWKSFKTKKTKAEIVRELLLNDLEKVDKY